MKRLIPLLFLLTSVVAFPSQADENPSLSSLKGAAKIIWKSRGEVFRFDQIVVIYGPEEADFETLDDFGSTVMRIRLTPDETVLETPGREIRKRGRRGKKIGVFPIGRDDLIAALLHQTPAQEKKIKISFLDFRYFGRIRYPKIIRFETKKSSLTLEWQHVSFQR